MQPVPLWMACRLNPARLNCCRLRNASFQSLQRFAEAASPGSGKEYDCFSPCKFLLSFHIFYIGTFRRYLPLPANEPEMRLERFLAEPL